MNPYLNCPQIETEHFLIRLITESDYESLFGCYHDKKAVEFMNDDNCDFGFYVETEQKMQETIYYWLEFYKKQYFVRFSIVDKKTGKAIGTIEGFAGETGVLRVDINSDFEKVSYLTELFEFAKEYFHEMFGNQELVTKAIPKAEERRKALEMCNWDFIGSFRNYPEYYRMKLS